MKKPKPKETKSMATAKFYVRFGPNAEDKREVSEQEARQIHENGQKREPLERAAVVAACRREVLSVKSSGLEIRA